MKSPVQSTCHRADGWSFMEWCNSRALRIGFSFKTHQPWRVKLNKFMAIILEIDISNSIASLFCMLPFLSIPLPPPTRPLLFI